MINDSHLKKLSKIKILISDVDGILTDGRILVSDQSEFKFFHVEDALATSLLNLADIPISFISARFSNATKTRLDELKIKHYFQGYLNKVKALDMEKLVAKTHKEAAKHVAAHPNIMVTSSFKSQGIGPLRAALASLAKIKEK